VHYCEKFIEDTVYKFYKNWLNWPSYNKNIELTFFLGHSVLN